MTGPEIRPSSNEWNDWSRFNAMLEDMGYVEYLADRAAHSLMMVTDRNVLVEKWIKRFREGWRPGGE